MTYRLVQFIDTDGERRVACKTDDATPYRLVIGVSRTYDLAQEAILAGSSMAAMIAARGLGEPVDAAAALAEGRVLAPLDHEDPAHAYVTGTGLTHLGSAAGRDAMHKKLADAETLTDSMRMFQKGVLGGKPAEGETGAQPEWFYKGDGSIISGPEQALTSPHFALDGGEEPEIVGLYLIGPDGSPMRLGYALGNEFSDHVTEKENYLYLAHSKLRPCSFGPELLVGELPSDVRGHARIRRGNETVWEKPFISGEDNMCHSLANLESHHFKYGLFRRPGDVHIHYFGTATASFADGIRTQAGDVFEIEASIFTLPLRNPLAVAADDNAQVLAL